MARQLVGINRSQPAKCQIRSEESDPNRSERRRQMAEPSEEKRRREPSPQQQRAPKSAGIPSRNTPKLEVSESKRP